jgi:hypothetical protein
MYLWSEWPGAHASIGADMGCSNYPKGNVTADFCAPVVSQKVRNSCHHGMARAGVFAASGLSALGQKQTFPHRRAMSALPPKADICSAPAHVRFGPEADMASLIRSPLLQRSADQMER